MNDKFDWFGLKKPNRKEFKTDWGYETCMSYWRISLIGLASIIVSLVINFF